jgi:uncharacterized lipoprotein YddW (UPF0748 family)
MTLKRVVSQSLGWGVLCLLGAVALAAPGTEHRGMWLPSESFDTPAKVDELVARVAAANYNTVYPLIWYRGGAAWYHTPLAPLAPGVDPSFDPLGTLIEKASARGIEVHGWFVNGSYGWIEPGHVFSQHPTWALQTVRPTRPRWYDLGQQEVRQFQTEIMLDCLQRYPLAGLHFDYIRYDGPTICLCEHCQKEFSRRTGLPPQTAGDAKLPVGLHLSANPVARPTTAKVLASFDNGIPAVTLNVLGQGQAAVLNWIAPSSQAAATDGLMKELLQRLGAAAGKNFQLNTSQTRARYSINYQQAGQDWLKGLGQTAKLIDETQLGQVPSDGLVLLFGQYLMAEETAAQLEKFVQGGGRALFVDGPIFAIKHPALQRVTGLAGAGQYFNAFTVISPAPGQDLLPEGPPVDIEREKQRHKLWVDYRTETITELVRSVYRGAKARRPECQVSAAVFYTRESATHVCQDWYGWLQEGIIDYVVPMAYTEKQDLLEKALEEWRAADPQMQRIIPGLSLYSSREGKTVNRDLELVLAQQALCRSYGARGTVCFSYGNFSEQQSQALVAGPHAAPLKPYYPAGRPQ